MARVVKTGEEVVSGGNPLLDLPQALLLLILRLYFGWGFMSTRAWGSCRTSRHTAEFFAGLGHPAADAQRLPGRDDRERRRLLAVARGGFARHHDPVDRHDARRLPHRPHGRVVHAFWRQHADVVLQGAAVPVSVHVRWSCCSSGRAASPSTASSSGGSTGRKRCLERTRTTAPSPGGGRGRPRPSTDLGWSSSAPILTSQRRTHERPTLNRRDLNRLALAALGGLVTGALAGCGGKHADRGQGPTGRTRTRQDKDAGAETTPAAAGPARLPGHQHLQEQGQEGHDQRVRRPGPLRDRGRSRLQRHERCKGQGGCGEHPGENECKGKGGCEVPLSDKTWPKARKRFEELMTKAGKKFGDRPRRKAESLRTRRAERASSLHVGPVRRAAIMTTPRTPRRRDLGQIQRWMQAVIMHPVGVAEGIASAEARRHIDVGPDEAERS